MTAEPHPRQGTLDSLTGERFGPPARHDATPAVPVGPGPTALYADQARAECHRRRARVLAHPDIAHRLTRPPLGFKQPEQWTGYIPPEIHGDRRNDSQRRVALVQIMQAVAAREVEAAETAAAEAGPAPDPVYGYAPPDPREEGV